MERAERTGARRIDDAVGAAEIEPIGDSCLLRVTHDQLREDANNQLYGGWPMILSGLKTWLETGELLTTLTRLARRLIRQTGSPRSCTDCSQSQNVWPP